MENIELGICFVVIVSFRFEEILEGRISVRLITFDARAILTMFQIPEAAGDPLTRTAALLSLMSALLSLTYGCIYIVRFGTMRSMYKASRWADVRYHKNKFSYRLRLTSSLK
jgi:hypothetical protein